MSFTFNQMESGVLPSGISDGLSGEGLVFTPQACLMRTGGAAGTTERFVQMSRGQRGVGFCMETPEEHPDKGFWQPTDHNLAFEVTTPGDDVFMVAGYVFRIEYATGLFHFTQAYGEFEVACDTAGIKDVVIPDIIGSTTKGHMYDRMYVALVFENRAPGSRQVGMIPRRTTVSVDFFPDFAPLQPSVKKIQMIGESSVFPDVGGESEVEASAVGSAAVDEIDAHGEVDFDIAMTADADVDTVDIELEADFAVSTVSGALIELELESDAEVELAAAGSSAAGAELEGESEASASFVADSAWSQDQTGECDLAVNSVAGSVLAVEFAAFLVGCYRLLYLTGLSSMDGASGLTDLHPNVPDDEVAASHADLRVEFGDPRQVIFGEQNRYVKTAFAVATVRVPVESGTKNGAVACDSIGDALRNTDVGGVWFGVPSISILGRRGDWFEFEVRCPMRLEEVADAADEPGGTLMGEFEDRHAAIRTRFQTLVTDVEGLWTSFDNMPEGDDRPNAEHLECNILDGTSVRINLNADTPRHRTPGVMQGIVYVPVGSGSKRALEIADVINLAFRSVTAGGVTYRVPSVGDPRRDGQFWRVVVTCPWISAVA